MSDVRLVDSKIITKTVAELCIKANRILPSDIPLRLTEAQEQESSDFAKSILSDLCRNIEIAKEKNMPVCQDTGMAVVFIDIGQDVHITGELLEDAVNQGVKIGYTEGFLRCSVVSDPINRVNSGDNTPAVIHTRIVKGDKITIMVAPKGFGSENMSAVKMLTPAASREDIINTVCAIAKAAGSNPCPPMVLGVGIGGDFEYCAVLAKRALTRDIEIRNVNPFYAQLEKDMLDAVNALGIGPQGFGGKTTALAVNIEYYPTHIAGLPLAVNMGCYVNRHALAEI